MSITHCWYQPDSNCNSISITCSIESKTAGIWPDANAHSHFDMCIHTPPERQKTYLSFFLYFFLAKSNDCHLRVPWLRTVSSWGANSIGFVSESFAGDPLNCWTFRREARTPTSLPLSEIIGAQIWRLVRHGDAPPPLSDYCRALRVVFTPTFAAPDLDASVAHNQTNRNEHEIKLLLLLSTPRTQKMIRIEKQNLIQRKEHPSCR